MRLKVKLQTNSTRNSVTLNLNLGRKKTSYTHREHRNEIKSWRLELGEATKENIKLEEKLRKLTKETEDTITFPILAFSESPLLPDPSTDSKPTQLSHLSNETETCSIATPKPD